MLTAHAITMPNPPPFTFPHRPTRSTSGSISVGSVRRFCVGPRLHCVTFLPVLFSFTDSLFALFPR